MRVDSRKKYKEENLKVMMQMKKAGKL